MKKVLRFLLTFLTAFVVMMVVRAIGITIYTIGGTGLEPTFLAGDRVMVNRWSYGLRVGGKDGLFGYGRIIRQPVGKGDLVAIENPGNTDEVLICRCSALPGDTIISNGQAIVVPSLNNCADADYYCFETVSGGFPAGSAAPGGFPAGSAGSAPPPHPPSFVAEEYIIGRAFMVVYSHDPNARPWTGWDPDRLFLLQ